jgi:hypothetical protein
MLRGGLAGHRRHHLVPPYLTGGASLVDDHAAAKTAKLMRVRA